MFLKGSLSVVLLYEIMIGIEFDRFGFVYTYRCKCTFWRSKSVKIDFPLQGVFVCSCIIALLLSMFCINTVSIQQGRQNDKQVATKCRSIELKFVYTYRCKCTFWRSKSVKIGIINKLKKTKYIVCFKTLILNQYYIIIIY